MSTKRDILTTLQTNLKAIDGTGDYVFDVSDSNGTVRVIIGRQVPPDIPPPCIYIHPIRANTSQEGGRTCLTKYRRELQVQVLAFVPTTTDDVGEPVLAALDMLDDIERALEADRTVGGDADDLEVEGEVFHGHEIDTGLGGMGVVVAGVSVTYHETSGA